MSSAKLEECWPTSSIGEKCPVCGASGASEHSTSAIHLCTQGKSRMPRDLSPPRRVCGESGTTSTHWCMVGFSGIGESRSWHQASALAVLWQKAVGNRDANNANQHLDHGKCIRGFSKCLY